MSSTSFHNWRQLYVAAALAAALLATLGINTASAAAFDINTATISEIESNLDGIGPVKAKAIIDYRRKYGNFKTTDDLLKVPGVGVGTVNKNFATLGLKRGSTPLTTRSDNTPARKANSKREAPAAGSTAPSLRK